MSIDLKETIANFQLTAELNTIAAKVIAGSRISVDDGIVLYEKADLGLLGMLANVIRERKNGNYAFFNKNFHIEPTNICVFNCKFCSYRSTLNDSNAWESDLDAIAKLCQKYVGKDVTEVHIVGGVHPNHNLNYYAALVQKVREILPSIHIKAYSAVELDYMFRKANITAIEGFEILKESGLNSIPGGGAEIFDENLRSIICPDKVNAEGWLSVHEAAHQVGISSNATILYGQLETYAQRIDHMNRLRELQDKTGGFNCFIPLKYRKENNSLQEIGEVTLIEDLKNFAVSRIFLDNFTHIKAYWPMIGKDMAQLSLSFGVDDIDGTIDDTTKIYSMAGVEDQKPSLSTSELVTLIQKAGRIAAERNSVYEKVREF